MSDTRKLLTALTRTKRRINSDLVDRGDYVNFFESFTQFSTPAKQTLIDRTRRDTDLQVPDDITLEKLYDVVDSEESRLEKECSNLDNVGIQFFKEAKNILVFAAKNSLQLRNIVYEYLDADTNKVEPPSRCCTM